MENLLENYLKYLNGTYYRDDIKAEILEFKNNGGNPEEFEQMVITATKGLYKKNTALEDFRKYYSEGVACSQGFLDYGPGHIAENRTYI